MPPIVDIHTHVYPPAYMAMLRSRRTVPYVHDPAPSKDGDTTPRLIILASDDDPSIPIDQRGRPVDSSYSDINVKLSFMRRHGITTSVISLANPWLDFLEPADAQPWAERINNDLEATCAQSNTDTSSTKSLYAFGTLPLTAPTPSAIVAEIHRLKTLPHLRGVIMGTSGLGKGLDDPALDPIWSALQETNTLVFLHPHYGLPEEAYGANGAAAISRSGHVMPLALGFPLETTIAVTRMLLAGAFDRFPKLTLLLAHSGGTLPFLAGRIESCIHHERKYVGADGSVVDGPRRSVWDVLKTNIYLDAVVYGVPALRAAVGASGADRLMFGTDHPFFPPLDETEPNPEWPSVTTNYDAIKEAFGDDKTADAVLGGNAVRVLDLK
ncbi:iso-orotate decarboxylase [Aspergillus campestris IBT 28561]|uniref:Iso-orotate decarboxylase n=1 Tax=Aspergillus campestris (strain IBT 28561) TaxID=1392248 RepID=A0A2I1D118_ASPC2|nr:iso-orotate decarboxylase [Aspergillus campestris IBT 28561]PKY03562.1 iso-orotate decarboxylase [Aspergillus campestris IBT 28561]